MNSLIELGVSQYECAYVGWYVVRNRFERCSCPVWVHFRFILGSILGSFLGSTLKRFDNDNENPPCSCPGSWTGWTMGGATPTTLPPLHSPFYKKYKSLYNGPLVTTSQALPVIRPRRFREKSRHDSSPGPPPHF